LIRLWLEGAESGVFGLVLVGDLRVVEEPAFVGVGADIGSSPAAVGLDGLDTGNLKCLQFFLKNPAAVLTGREIGSKIQARWNFLLAEARRF